MYNSNSIQQELNSNLEGTFDLRFTTINNRFLSTSHQLLNRKLSLFLNQTHSLKQFIRVKEKIFFSFKIYLYLFIIVITYDINSISVNRSIKLF